MGKNLLTYSEHKVLVHVANELDASEISRYEGISLSNVRDLLRSAYNKLGAQGATGAIAQAFAKGVLTQKDIKPRLGGRRKKPAPRACVALSWAACGLDTRDVAAKMHVSRDSVLSYYKDARQNLKVKTTEEAIKVARENDFLDQEILRCA